MLPNDPTGNISTNQGGAYYSNRGIVVSANSQNAQVALGERLRVIPQSGVQVSVSEDLDGSSLSIGLTNSPDNDPLFDLTDNSLTPFPVLRGSDVQLVGTGGTTVSVSTPSPGSNVITIDSSTSSGGGFTTGTAPDPNSPFTTSSQVPAGGELKFVEGSNITFNYTAIPTGGSVQVSTPDVFYGLQVDSGPITNANNGDTIQLVPTDPIALQLSSPSPDVRTLTLSAPGVARDLTISDSTATPLLLESGNDVQFLGTGSATVTTTGVGSQKTVTINAQGLSNISLTDGTTTDVLETGDGITFAGTGSSSVAVTSSPTGPVVTIDGQGLGNISLTDGSVSDPLDTGDAITFAGSGSNTVAVSSGPSGPIVTIDSQAIGNVSFSDGSNTDPLESGDVVTFTSSGGNSVVVTSSPTGPVVDITSLALDTLSFSDGTTTDPLANGDIISFTGSGGSTVTVTSSPTGPVVDINSSSGGSTFTLSDGATTLPVSNGSNVQFTPQANVTQTLTDLGGGNLELTTGLSGVATLPLFDLATATTVGDIPSAPAIPLAGGELLGVVVSSPLSSTLTSNPTGPILELSSSAMTDFLIGDGNGSEQVVQGNEINIVGVDGVVSTLSNTGNPFQVSVGLDQSSSLFTIASADTELALSSATTRTLNPNQLLGMVFNGPISITTSQGLLGPVATFNSSALDNITFTDGTASAVLTSTAPDFLVTGSGGITAAITQEVDNSVSLDISGSGLLSSFDVSDGSTTLQVSDGQEVRVLGSGAVSSALTDNGGVREFTLSLNNTTALFDTVAADTVADLPLATPQPVFSGQSLSVAGDGVVTAQLSSSPVGPIIELATSALSGLTLSDGTTTDDLVSGDLIEFAGTGGVGVSLASTPSGPVVSIDGSGISAGANFTVSSAEANDGPDTGTETVLNGVNVRFVGGTNITTTATTALDGSIVVRIDRTLRSLLSLELDTTPLTIPSGGDVALALNPVIQDVLTYDTITDTFTVTAGRYEIDFSSVLFNNSLLSLALGGNPIFGVGLYVNGVAVVTANFIVTTQIAALIIPDNQCISKHAILDLQDGDVCQFRAFSLLGVSLNIDLGLNLSGIIGKAFTAQIKSLD